MRIPLILRIDGKSFSRYTRSLKETFNESFITAMNKTGIALCQEIQGCQIAYIQSDEINILIHNYKNLNSTAWFDNKVSKIISITAGLASAIFTSLSGDIFGNIKPAVFDSRLLCLPEAEVNNYFIWRQQDCVRNSIQRYARTFFSHKDCNKKIKKSYVQCCMIKEWIGIN